MLEDFQIYISVPLKFSILIWFYTHEDVILLLCVDTSKEKVYKTHLILLYFLSDTN